MQIEFNTLLTDIDKNIPNNLELSWTKLRSKESNLILEQIHVNNVQAWKTDLVVLILS